VIGDEINFVGDIRLASNIRSNRINFRHLELGSRQNLMREFEFIVRFPLTVDVGKGFYLVISFQSKSWIVYAFYGYCNFSLRENKTWETVCRISQQRGDINHI
jgi:hypothetical protein